MICARGSHDFPYEDGTGAYCERHGVTLLWHDRPDADDAAPGGPPSPCAAPARPALAPAVRGGEPA